MTAATPLRLNTWGDRAYAEIVRLADEGSPFTADDVLAILGPPDESHEPNARNNAIGKVFARASAAGLIEQCGVTQSRQRHRKGGMIRVWRKATDAPQGTLWA